MVTIELPQEYGYVLLSAVSTLFVGTWLGLRVGQFRKAAKVPYPYEYASYEQVTTASPVKQEAMHMFNCAQRGHQNFNENQTSAISAMLISGLKYPKAAAALGAFWSVNRILYAIGYTSGREGGKGRYYGVGWMVAHYIMIIMAALAAWDFTKA